MEFCDEEVVDVVGVRIVLLGYFYFGIEFFVYEVGEIFFVEGEIGFDEFNVWLFVEGVLDDLFVFFDGYGIGGVDDVVVGFVGVVNGVDGGEEKLFLDVGELYEVEFGFVGFDRGIFGDDIGIRVRSIEKDVVEVIYRFREVVGVVV